MMPASMLHSLKFKINKILEVFGSGYDKELSAYFASQGVSERLKQLHIKSIHRPKLPSKHEMLTSLYTHKFIVQRYSTPKWILVVGREETVNQTIWCLKPPRTRSQGVTRVYSFPKSREYFPSEITESFNIFLDRIHEDVQEILDNKTRDINRKKAWKETRN